MTLTTLNRENNMKEITITKVENGYVVVVAYTGNQSLFDSTTTYVANDKQELLDLLKDKA